MAIKKKVRNLARRASNNLAPKKSPLRNQDLFVSQGQFNEFRYEVSHNFTSVHLEFKAVRNEMNAMGKRIDSRFNKLEGRFSEIDSRFNKVEGRFSEIDSRFNKVEGRFSEIDSRFDKVEARFSEIDARFDRIDAQFEELKGMVHKLHMVVEEQNVHNRFVLDGFSNLVFQVDANKKESDERFKHLENLIKTARDSEL